MIKENKFTRICPICGELVYHPRKKDCNYFTKREVPCRSCSRKKQILTGKYNPKEEFTCFTCKKTFMKCRSQISKQDRPYCSKHCWYNSNVKSLEGQRFGKLSVLEKGRERKNNTTFYACKCDCGNLITTSHSNLLSGSCKSCGCLLLETRGSERKSPTEVIPRSILTCYKRNAKNRGYIWDLSDEKFLKLINGNCYYCGSEPNNYVKHYYKYETVSLPFNGIDRIDNLIGYLTDNCVSCCKTCNAAKSDLTLDEFKIWSKKLSSHIDLI